MNKPTNGKGYSGFQTVHTLQETADHLGISVVSAFQIERRALKKLRAKLMEMGIRRLDDILPKKDKQDRFDQVEGPEISEGGL